MVTTFQLFLILLTTNQTLKFQVSCFIIAYAKSQLLMMYETTSEAIQSHLTGVTTSSVTTILAHF